MTSITILETTDEGDCTCVVVSLASEEIFSVEGEELTVPERAGEYHQNLHTNRVNHNHNKRTVQLSVIVPNPYSREKLDALLEGTLEEMAEIVPADFVHVPEQIQEKCFVNGGHEKHFYHMNNCPDSVKEELLAAFPGYDLTTIALISSSAYHAVTEESVISAFLVEDDVAALTHNGTKLITKCRKFCLTSKKFYDRCYAFCDETFSFIPDSCEIMGKSYHVNIETGLELPDFYDIYFSGDAEVVQTAFDLPELVGEESTYYGVTVVNGAVTRAKQYCYDHAGVFSDWQGAIASKKLEHNI